MIWFGGLLAGLLLYLLGPSEVLTQVAYYWDSFFYDLAQWLQALPEALYNMFRAGAIALMVVFWVLGLMAVRSGQPGRALLLVFSLIFIFLVGSPSHWGFKTAPSDWFAALVLAAAGALIMTGRVSRRRS
jgi:hypothetical protein